MQKIGAALKTFSQNEHSKICNRHSKQHENNRNAHTNIQHQKPINSHSKYISNIQQTMTRYISINVDNNLYIHSDIFTLMIYLCLP